MSRNPRNYLNTSFFHVITQGINKSYIFNREEDIKHYIKIMYELSREQNVKILAYCIMNNHAHMLIETKEIAELSKYMQRLGTKYGKYYNKKYNRVGYVFRDRFKAEGIYNEEHLYNCIKYIYNNPVVAGICKNAKDYPYSNYRKIDANIKENYIFMDVDINDNETCKKVLIEFLHKNDIDLGTLRKEESYLKEFTIMLKDRYKISFRKIACELGISKDKIRKVYNK